MLSCDPVMRHCLQMTPSLQGYLQFLAESKVVYDTFEDVLTDKRHPECKECSSSCKVGCTVALLQPGGLTAVLHRLAATITPL